MITYQEIKKRVHQAVKEVQTSAYDRVELLLCGCQVRAWRTRINCKTRYHIGYKASWERTYRETTADNLIEILVHYRGSHTEPEERLNKCNGYGGTRIPRRSIQRST